MIQVDLGFLTIVARCAVPAGTLLDSLPGIPKGVQRSILVRATYLPVSHLYKRESSSICPEIRSFRTATVSNEFRWLLATRKMASQSSPWLVWGFGEIGNLSWIEYLCWPNNSCIGAGLPGTVLWLYLNYTISRWRPICPLFRFRWGLQYWHANTGPKHIEMFWDAWLGLVRHFLSWNCGLICSVPSFCRYMVSQSLHLWS